ncbi:MAG TPA: hypothetical protein VLI05_05590 [Candidatus Saccharimonadia bacterium]|nr:hypothetical protein [Candidatus Saccharimonadia bacterium]
MHRWSQRLPIRVIVAGILAISTLASLVPAQAEAGFQQAYVRLDRMKANMATGGMVCAQPATVGTEAKVVVTFPITYTLNTTAANWTVTTTNIPSTATAWPGIGTATAADNSAKTVTFPSGDLTPGTLYCFNFAATNTLTTAAAAANSQQASIQTQTSGSAVVDLTQIALANIADDTITVTATVPPSFIFTLDGNADTFTSNLDPLSVVSTGGRTATITTNAKGGWIAWAKDQYQGLHSATAGYTINTAGTVNGAPSTLSVGSEGYVLDTDLTTDASGGCTLAIDPEYNGATVSQGGTLSGSFQPIASCTGASPATANGDVITMIERATISGATPASSDYTDVLTVVGAGNF